METLIFWKHYTKPERILLLFSGLLLFACFINYFFAFYNGLDGAIRYELEYDIERIESTSKIHEIANEEVKINCSNFITRTFFCASPIQFKNTPSKVFLVFFILGFSYLLTGISAIKKIVWYAFAMTCVGLSLYFFSFDLHNITYSNNNIVFACVFLAITALTFSFTIVRGNSTPVLVRFLTITALLLVVFAIILSQSKAKEPILSLTSFSMKSMTFIVYSFVLLIGYDIIGGFFSLITTSKSVSSKNSLANFLVISGIYLGSLTIFFLNKINYIQWNITLLNPFILLVISTIIGFWGQYKRSTIFRDVVSYTTGGLWIYMGLAIVSISTVAYSFQVYNTALIASFEEAIIYAHLTMGVGFIIYLLKNFRVDILTNQAVWHKLYSPKKLTHRFTRFIAFATVILLIIVDQNKPIKRWKSGIYTYKADVYKAENNKLLAQENYRIGYALYPANFKAQYMLTMMKIDDGKINEAVRLFEDMTTYRNPNEFAWINMANAYGSKKDYYNASYYLKKGLTTYPENGQLRHNLAYYNEKGKDMEHVFSDYVLAEKKLPDTFKHATLANLLALASQFAPSKTGDSLLSVSQFDHKKSIQANKVALGNIWQKPVHFEMDTQKKTLSPVEASLWVNTLNNSASISEVAEAANVAIENPSYFELINAALAAGYISKNNYIAADTLLRHTISASKPEVEQHYYYELGKLQWAFGNDLEAIESFRISYKKQPFQPVNDAAIYLAKLYLSNGAPLKGIEILQEIAQFEPYQKSANNVLYSLQFSDSVADTIKEVDALNLSLFNPFYITKKLYKKTLLLHPKEPLYLNTYARFVKETPTEAEAFFSSIKDSLRPKYLAKINFIRALECCKSKNYKLLSEILATTPIKGRGVYYKNYLAAMKAKGNNEHSLESKYLKEAYMQVPFYEPFGIELVDFFKETNFETAYEYSSNILAFNKGSLAYHMKFIEMALKNGDIFYADATLKSIEQLELLSPQDLLTYEALYEKQKEEAVETITSGWE